MEFRIEPSGGTAVGELKQDIIIMCEKGNFYGWQYKSFSIGEDALYKSIPAESGETTIAFILEEKENFLSLFPAKMKGSAIYSLETLSKSLCEVLYVLLSRIPLELSVMEIVINH